VREKEGMAEGGEGGGGVDDGEVIFLVREVDCAPAPPIRFRYSAAALARAPCCAALARVYICVSACFYRDGAAAALAPRHDLKLSLWHWRSAAPIIG